MKDSILTDVFTLVEIVRSCKQDFTSWIHFHSKTNERSMHFAVHSNSHYRLLIMDIHQTLNRSQSDKFTFWRIFARQESKEYEENAITLSDINLWRSWLNKYDAIITKIKIIRDTQIVHTDKEQPPPGFVSMAELQRLLSLIVKIILEILAILRQPITVIETVEEQCGYTLEDAYKIAELDRQQKLYEQKFGSKYNQSL